MTKREKRYLEQIRGELRDLKKDGYPAGDIKLSIGYDFCLFLQQNHKGDVRVPNSLIDDATESNEKSLLERRGGSLTKREANYLIWNIRIDRNTKKTYKVHCIVEK